MFEDMTFDVLLAEGKKQVSSDVIKTEGSLVHNAIAILAYELERFYIQLDWAMRQADPAKAEFEYLKIIAAARAVYPDPATYAEVRMEADAEVPIGARFSLAGYNYAVTRKISSAGFQYVMRCEEAGKGPNGLMGVLMPIDYVEGLTRAEITELLVPGQEASTKEELYQKYVNSFSENRFGGNIAEYKAHLMEFDGIGGAKVYPVWNGPGTVKGVLLGSDYGPVSDYLVNEIQNEMMPVPEKGYGIAPIGHTVTILSAEGVSVSVSTNVTFKPGYSWETLQALIDKAVDGYLLAIRKEWPAGGVEDFCTVYISRIEAAILDVTGVLDVSGTMINGEAANLLLTPDQVPVFGAVTGV